MKDLGSIMKQAQAMQQKLADAQARIAEIVVEGTSGGGMVKVTLKGTGEMAGVELLVIDEATTLAESQKQTRWNQAYYRLAQGL